MQIWHQPSDAPGPRRRVPAGERVPTLIGTSPIAPDQAVWTTYQVLHSDGTTEAGRVDATWHSNDGANSYWRAELGPFSPGAQVTYTVHGASPEGAVRAPTATLRVGPQLYLALLWHQHQPSYKDMAQPTERGSYLHPWVRLHAIRDYYPMAALVAEHPDLHLTINLTPVLLRQIDDYLEHGATDRSLELTLKPADALTAAEHEQLLSTFFDADWHNQIFPHPRYRELFIQRRERQPFSTQDLRDLQMWFNLAWFGQEFRDGAVVLPTGEAAAVRRFVVQERDFSGIDIAAMVEEQYKIMRAVVPIHRALQERGQIEVATTPFSHPILPLLVDTDRATLDRPGASYPPRFASPEDADAQVRLAVENYRRHFGQAPRGMWPAEGAVSQAVIPLFARHGVQWLATDQGVLARSGRWGYRAGDPDVLCQPYRAEEGQENLSVFFRDTQLSDAIGFHYQNYDDYAHAAGVFLHQIKERFARQLTDDGDRVLTIVLDGENAWGAYREDARPFLHALYGLLERDRDVQTVTFAEYLAGNPARGIAAHPIGEQTRVHELFTGSWIDEAASAPGVDLGTWIGEAEENRAWALLGRAREAVTSSGATPEVAPAAFDALYMAEGSDWFWWFGADQDSGDDAAFDDLFRLHLQNVYRGLRIEPPAELAQHIVPRAVSWTFTHQAPVVQPGDRLTIRTNCPGDVTWHTDEDAPRTEALLAAGGVMAGARRYQLTLGPFAAATSAVHFAFRCTQPACDGQNICCKPDEHMVWIGADPDNADKPDRAAGAGPPAACPDELRHAASGAASVPTP